MRTRKVLLILTVLASVALFCACSQQSSELHDGYYTAEAASFDAYGWKEYVTIYVSDNKIITVEYDAYNASGLVKSWDINYMRSMKAVSGTYPNEYVRIYAVALMNWQDPAGVDAISGATESHGYFRLLAEAVIEQARQGDKQVALVELPAPHSDEHAKG